MIDQLFPYAGSSRKIAPTVAEMIRREGYDDYAEPMVGSGAVFFSLMPRAGWVGDVEYHIANLYRQTRDSVDEVLRIFDTLLPVKGRFMELESEIRDLKGPQAAAVWYYLILLTYNGVVRKRKDEECGGMRPWFTWGQTYLTWENRYPTYCNRLLLANRLLNGIRTHWGSYERVPEASIGFFDPPWYDTEPIYGYSDDFDHQQLADYLSTYGRWILTINDRQETRDIYLPISAWHAEMSRFYGVAPVVQGKGTRHELLITNFVPKMYGG